jgi:hypothetical protein
MRKKKEKEEKIIITGNSNYEYETAPILKASMKRNQTCVIFNKIIIINN